MNNSQITVNVTMQYTLGRNTIVNRGLTTNLVLRMMRRSALRNHAGQSNGGRTSKTRRYQTGGRHHRTRSEVRLCETLRGLEQGRIVNSILHSRHRSRHPWYRRKTRRRARRYNSYYTRPETSSQGRVRSTNGSDRRHHVQVTSSRGASGNRRAATSKHRSRTTRMTTSETEGSNSRGTMQNLLLLASSNTGLIIRTEMITNRPMHGRRAGRSRRRLQNHVNSRQRRATTGLNDSLERVLQYRNGGQQGVVIRVLLRQHVIRHLNVQSRLIRVTAHGAGLLKRTTRSFRSLAGRGQQRSTGSASRRNGGGGGHSGQASTATSTVVLRPVNGQKRRGNGSKAGNRGLSGQHRSTRGIGSSDDSSGTTSGDPGTGHRGTNITRRTVNLLKILARRQVVAPSKSVLS